MRRPYYGLRTSGGSPALRATRGQWLSLSIITITTIIITTIITTTIGTITGGTVTIIIDWALCLAGAQLAPAA
jgi:Na+/H+ antiporter NhaC